MKRYLLLVCAFCSLGYSSSFAQEVLSQMDVVYGEHPRHKLDFYRAKSPNTTPVLIFFHGGGFVSGDKSKYDASQKLVAQCLENGISVVSANYRFVRDRDGESGHPFPAPMLDGARVIQFVRAKANEWQLDPARVGLAGSSAGACMSIWIALHDDMADADSDDIVARQSTRVSGVLSYAGQTTLDPRVILKHIGGSPKIHSSLKPFYNVNSVDELEKPALRKVVEYASALNFVSQDDPPLCLFYNQIPLAGTPLPPDASASISIHHPMFGKLMKDAYEVLGLQCVFGAKDVEPEMSAWAFLNQTLIDSKN